MTWSGVSCVRKQHGGKDQALSNTQAFSQKKFMENGTNLLKFYGETCLQDAHFLISGYKNDDTLTT